MIRLKHSLPILIFVFLMSSCAHKSGQYVFHNGKWVFKEARIGFSNYGIDFGRIDNGDYHNIDDMFIWPVPGSKKVSSHFGLRKGRHHDGVDIPAVTGTNIIASADGTVISSGWMSGYGKVIILKHKNGYHSVYAHTNKMFVKKGQKISQGEVIAEVGSTGRSSGPHLHFEIRKKNKVRNPANYLARLKRYLVQK